EVRGFTGFHGPVRAATAFRTQPPRDGHGTVAGTGLQAFERKRSSAALREGDWGRCCALGYGLTDEAEQGPAASILRDGVRLRRQNEQLTNSAAEAGNQAFAAEFIVCTQHRDGSIGPV